MLFNSLEFAIFLPVVFLLYQLSRKRVRLQNTLILASSYLFYGWWDVRFLQLIIISTAVDFLAALMIERGQVDRRLRVGASLYVLAGAVALIGIDWSGGPTAPSFFSDPTSNWIVGACLGGVVLANLAYGILSRLNLEARRKACLTLSIV